MSRAGLRALRIGTFSTLVRPRALACLALISLTAFILLGFGLTHGSLPIPTSAIGRALLYPQSLEADTRYIVMDIRLPRLLMAVLCGAMLGMAGAAMQSVTRNGLADPGLIGVKEGCSAAVLVLIFSSRRSAWPGDRWREWRGAYSPRCWWWRWRAIFRGRDLS